jgi:hypothetical protein
MEHISFWSMLIVLICQEEIYNKNTEGLLHASKEDGLKHTCTTQQ